MLEKSRVPLEFPHDRNFLIFYYLLAGLDSNSLGTLMLNDSQNHRITKLSDGVSNYQIRQWQEKFNDLRQAMMSQGFNDESLKNMYRILAIIILLCDIEFAPVNHNNQASFTKEVIYVKNQEVLNKVANLLCVEADDLSTMLISTVITTKSNSFKQ